MQQESRLNLICDLASWERAGCVSLAVALIEPIFNELHYEITRNRAEGRKGVVCEGVQPGAGDHKKTVAVKLIRKKSPGLKGFRKRVIAANQQIDRDPLISDYFACERAEGYGPANENFGPDKKVFFAVHDLVIAGLPTPPTPKKMRITPFSFHS